MDLSFSGYDTMRRDKITEEESEPPYETLPNIDLTPEEERERQRRRQREQPPPPPPPPIPSLPRNGHNNSDLISPYSIGGIVNGDNSVVSGQQPHSGIYDYIKEDKEWSPTPETVRNMLRGRVTLLASDMMGDETRL